MRLPRLRDMPFLLVLIGFVAWFVLLRPAGLGGPVSYIWVTGTSMEPGMEDGDLAVVKESDSYGVGDVVAFRVPRGEAGEGRIVIHRIVGGSAAGFLMQGDNKPRPDWWSPSEEDVVGVLWFMVPGGGRLLGRLRDPAMSGALAAAITVFTVLLGGGAPQRRAEMVPMPGVSAWRRRDAWTLAELCTRHRAVTRAEAPSLHRTALAIVGGRLIMREVGR
jgi:signal peptidase I